MNWSHLPEGVFREALERGAGKFSGITYLDKRELFQDLERPCLKKIEAGELVDFTAKLAELWDMPSPTLYTINDNALSAAFSRDSGSIILGGPIAALDSDSIKGVLAHEFGHGFQKFIPNPDIRRTYYNEFQADVYSAAFCSTEVLIKNLKYLEKTFVRKVSSHPSAEDRIENIVLTKDSEEFLTWVERGDRESLSGLLAMPFR